VLFFSVRTAANQRPQQTGAARPNAGRPAQPVRNQNAGSGDIYNAGGDAGRTEELTTQVMARLLMYAMLKAKSHKKNDIGLICVECYAD